MAIKITGRELKQKIQTFKQEQKRPISKNGNEADRVKRFCEERGMICSACSRILGCVIKDAKYPEATHTWAGLGHPVIKIENRGNE